MKAHKTYRGFRIERYEGFQMGHKTNAGLRASLGLGTCRKYKGWQLFYPDSDGSKIVDTLKEAHEYIDAYLS